MQAHCGLWAICNLLGNTVQVEQTFKHTVDMLSHTPLRQTLHAYNRISVDSIIHSSDVISLILSEFMRLGCLFHQPSCKLAMLLDNYMDSIRAYFPFTFNLLLAFSQLLGVLLFREVTLGTMASDWSQFFL